MSLCKIIKLLFTVLPLRGWRDFLVRNHLEVCPRCRAELASREEAASLLVQARDIEGSAVLWPRVRRRLAKEVEKMELKTSVPRMIRQYAAGAAALLATVFAAFWLLQGVRQSDVPSLRAGSDIRFEIKYIRVGGETANAIIYQPQNSDAIFVWAGKNE